MSPPALRRRGSVEVPMEDIAGEGMWEKDPFTATVEDIGAGRIEVAYVAWRNGPHALTVILPDGPEGKGSRMSFNVE
eukprot:8318270-Pyramimonas_sp.AAC.1